MLRSEAVEQIGPGNLDIPLGGKKKKEPWALLHTIYKNLLETFHKFKSES